MDLIMGMNSGSSFDGIDVILAETEMAEDGFPKAPRFICGGSYEWPKEVADIVQDAFVNKVDMVGLNRLNYLCGAVFAEKAAQFMKENNIDSRNIKVLGLDTQTIYQEQPNHAAIAKMTKEEKDDWVGRWLSGNYPCGTQMGDTSVIANLVDIDTVTHFRPADHTSGGAAAPLMPLSFNARVVVFDEPTASLSEKESQTLFKLIKELKAKGVCIVYISHRMEEVFELSDRITVFRNGKYIDTVNTKDVQEKDIISMMIGHELNIEKKSGSEFVNKDKVVLEVKNVEVFPGAKPVNFKLYEKEILGFFGLVGAGRTELARVIFGVDPIGSGEIYVEGGKVKISSPKDAIQAGIGLVPEDRKGLGLILGMSIKDNMLISKIGQFKSSLLNKKALKNITGTFISDLGISLRNEEQEVKELSGGNQQKVVIAKWLAMKPNILIMDEPTRGIDIGAKSEIYALMRKMTEQGMSIIMISSEMSEVMQVSDRILVMHEGSISGELTAEEVTRNNIMQAAFGGVKE